MSRNFSGIWHIAKEGALCGIDSLGDDCSYDDSMSIDYYVRFAVGEGKGWWLCEECKDHPDFALMLLGELT